MNKKYIKKAKEIIDLYNEGSDLDEETEHVLLDCADEHGERLHTASTQKWFINAVAENLYALDCFIKEL